MDNKKLEDLRDDINSLDDKILDLLKERSEIVTEICEQKKSHIEVVDYEREQKILDRIHPERDDWYNVFPYRLVFC